MAPERRAIRTEPACACEMVFPHWELTLFAVSSCRGTDLLNARQAGSDEHTDSVLTNIIRTFFSIASRLPNYVGSNCKTGIGASTHGAAGLFKVSTWMIAFNTLFMA
jgi:hypothetical protein